MQQVYKTNFSLVSLMDNFGRVFFQDEKVYRAIKKENCEYCLNLLESDLFHELLEKGYVPNTRISDLHIENYELVLEHEKLLETFKHEWTFTMLKDAAATILEINKICNKHGYELKDAHLSNVLFKGTNPVWVDIGSIAPIIAGATTWRAYNEYLSAIIVPLSFLSCGKPLIGRKLLETIHYRLTTLPDQDIIESDLLSLLPMSFSEEPYVLKFRNQKLLKTNERLKFFSSAAYWISNSFRSISKRNTVLFTYEQELTKAKALPDLFPQTNIESYVNLLQEPVTKTMWTGYHQKSYYNPNGEIVISKRFHRVLKVIKERNDIQTVIDLAGNEGLFSELLFHKVDNLKQIITADYDRNAIDSAYNKFKKFKTDKLHTVLLNFMYTPNMETTQKRLKSDLALALAITHHLILTESYSIEAIFEKIKSYSNKYVMIEFMPLGLWNSNDENFPIIPYWYRIDWFRNQFKSYFDIILEEKLEVNRILFFGEIK